MIHSSRRNRKSRLIAEVLATIAAAQRAPYQPRSFHETNERLWGESATEFSAALETYYAERAPQTDQTADETRDLKFAAFIRAWPPPPGLEN
jgi:hypothetical protein